MPCSTKLVWLGWLIVLMWSGTAATLPDVDFWPREKPREKPAGMEVSLSSDRTNYFLGENILLHYRISNQGSNEFAISVGGDYRGSTRPDRFKVNATSSDGKEVADPTPLMRNMGGGMMPISKIKPGGEWFEEVQVIEYCRFGGPGIYTIHVFHDLGFGAKTANDPRDAVMRIELQAPTEAKARAILAEAENAKPYSGNTWGQKGEARLDYRCIRWPTFLNPLLERAKNGNESALNGLASINTLEASRALVGLLEHTDAAFVAKVAKLLELRLPHPESEFTNSWGNERRQFVVTNAWDDNLNAATRAASLRLLKQNRRADVLAATAMLRLIGTAKEISALQQALEVAVTQTDTDYLADVHYPAPIRVCDSLVGTVLAIQPELKMEASANLSPGQTLLFLSTHTGVGKVLSPNDEAEFGKLMGHPLAYVRMKTLESLPKVIPASLANLITQRMTDTNTAVQNYAFLSAEQMQEPRHREIALAVLRFSGDQWLRDEAHRIALKYNARYECALAWCAHLNTPNDINDYTTHDALRHLFQLTVGRLSGGGFNPRLDAVSSGILRQNWETFLTKQRTKVQAGHLFVLGDEDMPTSLLPSGWELNK